MAEDLTAAPAPVAPARSPYAGRLWVAAGVLLALVVAAGLLTWLLLGHDRPTQWSTFKPTKDDPVDRAVEIADFVQDRYLGAPGQPLVTINAGEDVIPNLPGHDQVVALTDANQGPYSYEAYPAGISGLLFYKLCGPAGGCTLDPAAPRPLLLSIFGREALELALYGLKYVDPAEGVIVELPTAFEPPATPGAPLPRLVFYFPRKRVEHLLDRPIGKTFPTDPPLPEAFTGADLGDVAPLVQTSLYRMEINPADDQTSIIYRLVAVPAA